MDFETVKEILEYILQGFGALTLLASTIASMTKGTTKDDSVARGMKKVLDTALKYAPTLGVDPKIKKLEEALAEAQAKLK